MSPCSLALSAALSAALLPAAAAADPAAVAARLAEVKPLLSDRVAAHPPPVPETAWAQAAAGETVTGVQKVDGFKARIGWGVAVLDVPISRMWGALNEELYHQDLLGLGHVEVVRGEPCADRRRVMMLLPLPIVSDRWWVVENRENASLAAKTGGRVRELTWKEVAEPASEPLSDAARARVEGAVPVAFNEGAWLLIDLDGGRTLAEYHAWSDPGGELPSGAASRFANSTIAATIDKLETYARTAPVRCPGG